jgi:UDP-N-acetylmuramate dehydrogenase
MQIQKNFPLKNHNTFGIDVLCDYFVEYESVQELLELFRSGFLADKRFYCIGGGCNLLFTKDFKGVLLHSQIKGIDLINEDKDSVFVRVGAAVVWEDFVSHTVRKGWGGAENLSFIPGEVGASPVQNIGAYGVEAKDIIYQVEGLNLDTLTVEVLANEDCHFDYRDSIFKHELKGKFIITHVIYKLAKVPCYQVGYGTLQHELSNCEIHFDTIREAIWRNRNSKLPDPKDEGNAGSFFKNPVVSNEKFEALQKEYPAIPYYKVSDTEIKIPAAWLIEQSGWKGKAYGNAAVHDKQALVLVNKTGKATGEEVVELSQLVQKAVKEKFDIAISPEVIFL